MLARLRHKAAAAPGPKAVRDPNGHIVGVEHGIRRFALVRERDVSGVSGTGVVAEGVAFTGGGAVIQWTASDHRSTVVWESVASIEAIHGHDGATRIVWLDA